MDAMEAILSRRSIRKYTSSPVPDSLVEELLKAGMSAPSSGNEQPWHFVVINERSVLDNITKFHPYATMVKETLLAIVVCGDPTLKKGPEFWVQDCSAATENILLAAHARGLGAVWLGIYPMQDRVAGTRTLLSLPEHVIPLAIIPIGYPGETKPPANRYNATRVHRNRW